MEITTRFLSASEHRIGMVESELFYQSKGVRNIFVAYGWGCDCPDDELYKDKWIHLSEFQRFVSAAEATDYYRVSKDNLHVKDENGRSEFLFCHETDIHFKTDDISLQQEVQALWQRLSFERVVLLT